MSKIGRNQPCPCGSGRKYKHCCLRKDQEKRVETVKQQLNANFTPEDVWKLRVPLPEGDSA